jgi:hypothetical protein
MASPGKAGKGGSAGATNADLQDDEDLMARRLNFDNWKSKRKKSKLVESQMISYDKSPNPPIKRT